VDDVQSHSGGIGHLSVETVEPIVRRGVLFDIAGLLGVPALEADVAITPDHLERAQKAEVREGDIVLIRTGWGAFFQEPERYVNQTKCPGPVLEGAKWLSERKVFAAGSDTLAFEKVPSTDMPVHIHMLVESGIHLIENLNLEALAGNGVSEFIFVAAPLKIRGGTGAPVRPLAFAGGVL
jgi:kynurenine formamidase